MTDQPMTTEAGKRLLANIIPEDWGDGEWTFPLDPASAIAAIEAEARAPLEVEIARLDGLCKKLAEELEGREEQIARQAATDGTLSIAFDAVRAEAEIARLREFTERQADLLHDRHTRLGSSWRTCNFWMCEQARAALAGGSE